MAKIRTKRVAGRAGKVGQRLRALPGLRAGAAVIRKGRARADSILEAAREIIVMEGYNNFTMRQVAAKVGISLGNLQHYFADRAALLRELLSYLNRRYDEDYAALEAAAAGDRDQLFHSFIDYLLEDDRKPLVRGLYLQFWALSSNDEYISQVMEAGYTYYRKAIATAIKTLNPALDPRELRARSMLIQSLVAGVAFSLRNRGGRLLPERGLFDRVRREATRIAKRGAPGRTR